MANAYKVIQDGKKRRARIRTMIGICRYFQDYVATFRGGGGQLGQYTLGPRLWGGEA